MPTKPLSRRNFLKAAGLTLGASSLACCGLSYLAASAPQAPRAPEPETPSFFYGKDSSMGKRILVTYATRTGSTVGVASAIGETLGARGFTVDVRPVKEDPPVDGYQSVVIGSAVNGAQWLPEAVEFVANHREALNRVPVVLFCVHIMNLGDDQKSKANRMAYLKAVRSLVKPVDEAYFAGLGMEPDQQAGFARWAYHFFKVGPEGDCRDWNKIRGWAQTVFA